MGGDAALFESCVKEVDGKWLVDDSGLPKKYKRITFRRTSFPAIDMSKHLIGAKLVQYIKAFDKAHGFRGGNTYHIGGQEVVI